MNPITKSIDLGDGKIITLETGKLAKQAHGSVVLTVGKTKILATVVSNYEAREGVDFLPLSVDYQEKFASVGRIPGGFLRREARLSDYEILICRIVDRALRPMFPSDYHAETQVMLSLISSDENIMPDALVGLAASAAITLTDIPFEGPISEVRVARIDGKFVLNPYKDELENADIDLIVAGTEKDLNMVEGEMSEVAEEDMLEALKIAHDAIKIQCKAQLELAELNGGRKEPREYNHEVNDEELEKAVMAATYDKAYAVAKEQNNDKAIRSEKFGAIIDEYIEAMSEEEREEKAGLAKKYYGKVKKKAVRDMMLNDGLRLDGRKFNEIRQIWTEVDYLPAAHGSALFTRGETQSLTTVTLGSKLDEQMLDTPMHSGYNKFMLHYNFPAFSTGEARPNRGPGRREIGHGNLAMRGLKRMLPEDNPYTIRVVSDILESNGSSSMATVCAGSMALMDAGIKMKSGVSGIAMGLISDEETGKYVVLSDILGDEDHLGDMDFKVVGTPNGLLACQMDMKVNGLSYEVLAEALHQAKEGRLHILGEMQKTISEGNADLKPHAPRIHTMQIDKDFIGAVIGKGGEVIQKIQKETGAEISISEDGDFGIVEIASNDAEAMQKAIEWIEGIIAVPVVGETYVGKVKNVMDFGAFVEFLPGKDGLLHISEISWERLNSMEGVFEDNEEIKVQLIAVDERTGKFKLSRKVLLPKPEGYVERPPREDRGPRHSHGRIDGRRDDRRRDDRGGRDNKRRDDKPRNDGEQRSENN